MNTRIVYIHPETNKLAFLTIPQEMFEKASDTRLLLRSHGVDFNSDQEVVDWVAKERLQGENGLFPGIEYHYVDASNFPVDDSDRENWVHDAENNRVISSNPD